MESIVSKTSAEMASHEFADLGSWMVWLITLYGWLRISVDLSAPCPAFSCERVQNGVRNPVQRQHAVHRAEFHGGARHAIDDAGFLVLRES